MSPVAPELVSWCSNDVVPIGWRRSHAQRTIVSQVKKDTAVTLARGHAPELASWPKRIECSTDVIPQRLAAHASATKSFPSNVSHRDVPSLMGHQRAPPRFFAAPTAHNGVLTRPAVAAGHHNEFGTVAAIHRLHMRCKSGSANMMVRRVSMRVEHLSHD